MFGEVGTQSGFNYADAFDFYKEAILRAILEPDTQEQMKETMLMWNEIVFKSRQSPAAVRSQAWRRAEGMSGLLGRMRNVRIDDKNSAPQINPAPTPPLQNVEEDVRESQEPVHVTAHQAPQEQGNSSEGPPDNEVPAPPAAVPAPTRRGGRARGRARATMQTTTRSTRSRPGQG